MNTLRICESCRAELPANSTDRLCPACRESKGSDFPARSRGLFSPPTLEELKGYFPQLELLERLGHGGMGVVYRARQRGLGRLVALKVLPPELSEDRSFADRFAREAQALARLCHPNIITVFDLGQSGPYYYFLMEYVDGGNLRQLLDSRQLSAREAIALMPQICDALECAHQEGVIHRDIKPENILVDRKGRVKIADFGLSRLLGAGRSAERLTQPDQVLGTLHYMAPEQFEAPLAVDHRADIYSLGVVFYEMLAGELPLGRFEPPAKKAGVDLRYDELILQALERNPARRPQQVSDIRLQVEGIAGMASKLSPEVSRKLSYEYRSKVTLFGLPLLHVAIGVNPATGRKRSARGIVALGSAPRGLIAFGDVAVGVVACGIFGYGLVSISVVAIGAVAVGSLAVGLWLAMGGVAVAPIALGGAAFGYYANGAMTWARHALGPNVPYDPRAEQFFNPVSVKLAGWVLRLSLVCVPVFLALGFVPTLMARMAERRAGRIRSRSVERGDP
jgi:hypothetical protein